MGRVRASKSALLHANGRTARRSVSEKLPLSNRQIAELLAVRGEAEESYKRKAYLRAAHAAFMWPVEAAELVRENRSLTELIGIGPSLAKTVTGWIENPPELPPTSPLRKNFLTLTEARAVIDSRPDWRTKVICRCTFSCNSL